MCLDASDFRKTVFLKVISGGALSTYFLPDKCPRVFSINHDGYSFFKEGLWRKKEAFIRSVDLEQENNQGICNGSLMSEMVGIVSLSLWDRCDAN